jgi:two-component system, NarL family, sensor kinase
MLAIGASGNRIAAMSAKVLQDVTEVDPEPASANPAMQGGRLIHLAALVSALVLLLTLALTALLLTTPSDATAVLEDRTSLDGLQIDVMLDQNSGLRAGDLVLEVDGRSVGNRRLPDAETGAELEYTVRRGSGVVTVPVTPGGYPIGNALSRQWASLVLIGSMLGVSIYVYARRPFDESAQLLLLVSALLTFGSTIWVFPLQILHSDGGALWWMRNLAAAAAVMTWPAMLHLALVLLGAKVDRFRGWLKAFYALPLAIYALDVALRLSKAHDHLSRAEAWVPRTRFVEVLFTLMVVAGSVWAYRTADTATRRRSRWVIATFGAAAVANVALWTIPQISGQQPLLPESVHMLIFVPCPIAIGIAILRVQLFDIEVIVRRSVVYVFLTACAALIYLVGVGLLSFVLPASNRWTGLGATGLVAVVFTPLHNHLRRIVSQWVYGQRDDPYVIVSLLGERLQESSFPNEIMPRLIETVAERLRLPYVAIELVRGDEVVETRSVGELRGAPLVLPLRYQNELVGRLIVGERTPGEGFGPRDRRVLEGLAGQVGVAAQAALLTLDLQRSRERLVTAREEERRRIRQDLHDGLGPNLAASALQLQAASRLAAKQSDAVPEILSNLAGQVQESITEVRRIVEDLRPAMLDQLGLVGALKEQAGRFESEGTPEEAPNGFRVSVETEGDLEQLPAAVEVAAFRIASEALNNAYRHGHASSCTVRIRRDSALDLQVIDNGSGIAEVRRSGVGLTSMRERASELGGSLTVERREEGGTAVSARIPLSHA